MPRGASWNLTGGPLFRISIVLMLAYAHIHVIGYPLIQAGQLLTISSRKRCILNTHTHGITTDLSVVLSMAEKASMRMCLIHLRCKMAGLRCILTHCNLYRD